MFPASCSSFDVSGFPRWERNKLRPLAQLGTTWQCHTAVKYVVSGITRTSLETSLFIVIHIGNIA